MTSYAYAHKYAIEVPSIHWSTMLSVCGGGKGRVHEYSLNAVRVFTLCGYDPDE